MIRTLPAVLVLVALVVAVNGPDAAAQGTIIESQPAGSRLSNPSQTLGNAASASNSDALTLLLEQNQQLRAEIQALRGMVEEQGFEIRKLQRDSLNRYSNIDQRLVDLENSSPSPGSSTAAPVSSGAGAATPTAGNSRPDRGISNGISNNGVNNRPANGGTATLTPRNPALGTASGSTSQSGRGSRSGGLQPAVLSEQQLYQMAYDSVINSDFELSIAEFDQYLGAYPQGRFITNAHYWKGQAYLYLNRFAEARDSYEIILDDYPDSPKLPDAMYGLGLAYQGLGNIPQARQLLNDIKRRFPNTGVANLADTRLLTLD